MATATTNDWVHLPMPDAKTKIPLNFSYSKKQFDRIRQGFIPQHMDDKWFIWIQDGHIFFHRSWSGIMIYDCVFEEKQDTIQVLFMHANRNSNEYLQRDDQLDVLTVKNWLDWLSREN